MIRTIMMRTERATDFDKLGIQGMDRMPRSSTFQRSTFNTDCIGRDMVKIFPRIFRTIKCQPMTSLPSGC